MYKITKIDDIWGVTKQDNEEGLEDFRPIVGENLQNELVEIIHSKISIHQGMYRTAKRLLTYYYLPIPTVVIKDVINKCLNCARKTKNPDSKIKTHQSKLNSCKAEYPLETLFLDFFGPFSPSDGKNKACLSVRDSFTNFLWLFPVQDLTAKTVVQNLETRIFTQFGQCRNLVFDNAQAFKSNLVTTLCNRWGIKAYPITPYNAAANKVERAHKDIGNALRAALTCDMKWSKLLTYIQLALNSSLCNMRKFTPFYLMFGRNALLSREITHPSNDELNETDTFAKSLAERIKKSF